MTDSQKRIDELEKEARRLEAELRETYRSVTELTNELEASKERLEVLSFTDELTGLYNRRFFLKRLEQEMVRARRYQSPLCLLLIDLDRFKRVNDTFGHLVGDEVLSKCAGIIQQAARQSDIAGRYGGEEFCILTPETSMQGAKLFADRLRERMATEPHAAETGTTFNVTCSIGVAQFNPSTMAAMTDFLRLTDRALYRAKDMGRNRAATVPVEE